MKIYDAFIINIGNGDIGTYEQFVIKASSKAAAWDNAVSIAFSDLFATGKMIIVHEKND